MHLCSRHAKLSGDSSEDEVDVADRGAALGFRPPASPRPRSRSPFIRSTVGATSSSSWDTFDLHKPTFRPCFRPGIDWWAKPFYEAVKNIPMLKHVLDEVPPLPMVHLSGRSGMLSELLTKQVATYARSTSHSGFSL